MDPDDPFLAARRAALDPDLRIGVATTCVRGEFLDDFEVRGAEGEDCSRALTRIVGAVLSCPDADSAFMALRASGLRVGGAALVALEDVYAGLDLRIAAAVAARLSRRGAPFPLGTRRMRGPLGRLVLVQMPWLAASGTGLAIACGPDGRPDVEGAGPLSPFPMPWHRASAASCPDPLTHREVDERLPGPMRGELEAIGGLWEAADLRDTLLRREHPGNPVWEAEIVGGPEAPELIDLAAPRIAQAWAGLSLVRDAFAGSSAEGAHAALREVRAALDRIEGLARGLGARGGGPHS